MRSERIYPIPQLKGEQLFLSWDDKFRDLDISFRGKIIYSLPVMKEDVECLEMSWQPFEKLELRFDRQKKIVNITIDGLQSPANSTYPARVVRHYGFYFVVLALFGFLTVQNDLKLLGATWVLQVTPFIVAGTYAVTALFIFLGKSSAYWIGFGLFVLLFLLNMCFGSRTGIDHDVNLLMRGSLAIIGGYGARLPIEMLRYPSTHRILQEDLLDDD